jgi:hypothetical protein
VTGSGRVAAPPIELESGRITARELIRSRVRKEVERFNASGSTRFMGLIQPDESERVLNGYEMKRIRRLDSDVQFEKAVRAFEDQRLILLADDRQVESLDEELSLNADSEVVFLKLMPLIGG